MKFPQTEGLEELADCKGSLPSTVTENPYLCMLSLQWIFSHC